MPITSRALVGVASCVIGVLASAGCGIAGEVTQPTGGTSQVGAASPTAVDTPSGTRTKPLPEITVHGGAGSTAGRPTSVAQTSGSYNPNPRWDPLPPAAEPHDKAGAEAMSLYLIQQYNFALMDFDRDAPDYFLDDCTGCVSLAIFGSRLKDQEVRLGEPLYPVTGASATAEPDGAYKVVMPYPAGKITYVEKDGTVSKTENGTAGTVTFHLVWDPEVQFWRVQQFEQVSH